MQNVDMVVQVCNLTCNTLGRLVDNCCSSQAEFTDNEKLIPQAASAVTFIEYVGGILGLGYVHPYPILSLFFPYVLDVASQELCLTIAFPRRSSPPTSPQCK